MPKIVTRSITVAVPTNTKRATPAQEARQALRAQHQRERKERAVRHEYNYTGGVTRCSRCPPQRTRSEPHRFCADCASINRARQHAGLIRPSGSPDPSPANIINPLVVGKYRGPSLTLRRFANSPQPVVTAFVEKLGGGWRRGVATLNGKRVYEGRPTRSQSDAWDYAGMSADCIRTGLRFESELADMGVL